MTLGIMINFDGDCREAVESYAEAFQLPPPSLTTYGEGDASFDPNVAMSDAGRDRIMHALLDIKGTPVTFCDMPDDFAFNLGNSHHLNLVCRNAEKAGEMMRRPSDGGRVFVPLAELPDGSRHGMVADRFGMSWVIQVR